MERLDSYASRSSQDDYPAFDDKHQTLLNHAVDGLTSGLIPNEHIRQEFNHYACGALKSFGLFAHGRLGMGFSIATHALDAARMEDPAGLRLFDAALGGLKGYALKRTFGMMGDPTLNLSTRAITLGFGSRLVDTALTRHNYLDERGEFNLGLGLTRMKHATFDPTAMQVDLAAGLLAHGAGWAANRFTGGAIERSPFLTTVLNGGAFGMVTGAHGEVIRQKSLGVLPSEIDWSKVLLRSALQGGTDAIASTGGGVQADARVRAALASRVNAAKEGLAVRWNESLDGANSLLDRLLGPRLTPAFAMADASATGFGARGTVGPFIFEPAASSPSKGPFVAAMTMADLPGWERSGFSSPARAEPVAKPQVERQEPVYPVRAEDLASLSGLYPEQRVALLQDGIADQNYHIRMLSIAKMGELDPADRLPYFEKVLTTRGLLEYPVNEKIAARYGGLEEAGRVNPGESTEVGLQSPLILGKSPVEIIADQIAAMPDKASKERAWTLLFDQDATRDLALDRVHLLEPSSRPAAWQRARDFYFSEFSERYLPAQEQVVRLLDILPQDFRPVAWEQVEHTWAQSRIARKRQTEQSVPPVIEWAAASESLGKMELPKKLQLAEYLERCPVENRTVIQQRLFNDTDPAVRLMAVSAIGKLPPGERWDAFKSAIKHADYNTRKVAIETISTLPASKRGDAISLVLSNKAVLSKPLLPPDLTWSKKKDEGPSRRLPPLPEGLPEPMRNRLEPSAEALLVEQVRSLPGRNAKIDTWQKLHDNAITKDAAIERMDVLPPDVQARTWSGCWKDVLQGDLESRSRIDTEIRRLPDWDSRNRSRLHTRYYEVENQSADALNNLIRIGSKLSGEAVIATWDATLSLLGARPLENGQSLGPDHLPADASAASGRLPWFPPRAHEYLAGRVSTEYLSAVFGAIPESITSDPRSRIGEWHRLHRFVLENAERSSGRYVHDVINSKRDFGLSSMISHLPESARESAWNAILLEHNESSWPRLGENLALLPRDARLRCFEKLCRLEPCGESLTALKNAAPHICGDSIPHAVEALVRRSDQARVGEVLAALPLSSMSTSDVNAACKQVAKIFESVGRDPDLMTNEQLRFLWEITPETKELEDKGYCRLRELLVERVPQDILLRILFDPEHMPVAQKFAEKHPEIIKLLARDQYSCEANSLATLAQVWLTTDSLGVTADVAMAIHKKNESSMAYSLSGALVGGLTKAASLSDRQNLYASLRQRILAEPSGDAVAGYIDVAAKVLEVDPGLSRVHFLNQIEAALADHSRNYQWRLAVARGMARLEFEGKLGGEHLVLPDMRMRGLDLPEARKEQVRQKAESALLGQADLPALMGNGELGRLFPAVFGFQNEGGIVGRPQHGGHEFPVDEHTYLVVERVRESPDFKRLSSKDQINVLWAALLHDVGKRPAVSDPGHEWASANIGWGVLETMGYPPERIQRIANLIRRHSDVSFKPEGKQSVALEDPVKAQDLAVFYRHPSALPQLMALNSADIRSIDSRSSLWTPEVQSELRAVAKLINQQRRILDDSTVPLLTDKLPERFGLFSLTGDYGVLVHASNHLDSAFLRQLSVIESSRYSMSTSYLTGRHHRLYNPEARMVAIVKAPPEHFSAVDRENMGTGTNVDWDHHVSLAFNPKLFKDFPQEIDTKLSQLYRQSGGKIKSLRDLWQSVGQFDNLTELKASADPDTVRAYLAVAHAMTTAKDGTASKGHNEGKVISPLVVGFGLLRRGEPVVFEGFDPRMHASLFTDAPPPWFIPDFSSSGTKALRVPFSIWQEAHKRRLPIISLEQSSGR